MFLRLLWVVTEFFEVVLGGCRSFVFLVTRGKLKFLWTVFPEQVKVEKAMGFCRKYVVLLSHEKEWSMYV